MPAALTLLRGLPASGKSTLAAELCASGAVRVNKDSLRLMLHSGLPWSPRLEGITHEAAEALVSDLLRRGRDVVVDDTNLSARTLNGWIKLGAGLGITADVRTLETDPEECVRRDALRTGSAHVGPFVIRNMALRSGLVTFPPKSLVLCDLDGTLADCTHRLKYAHGPEKDWDKFFVGVGQDTLRESTRELLREHVREGRRIIFVSARPERVRQATRDWLALYGIRPEGASERSYPPYYTLLMRADHDRREDSVVKQEMLGTYFGGVNRAAIHSVIDDRPRVIAMWRRNGLDVTDVGTGEEF